MHVFWTWAPFFWTCTCFSPHLCVGFLFLVLHPVRLRPASSASSRPPPPYLLTHNLLTHNLHTHNFTHTQLAHTQLTHTQLAHTHTCSHNLLTHTYSHTTYSHTTCSHTTYSHTTCSHTTCSHTTCTYNLLTYNNLLTQLAHTQLDSHTNLFTSHNLSTDNLLRRRGVLQAWHFDPPSLCVAGMALGDMDRALCVAGVALMALGWLWWRAWFPGGAGTPRRFAWQAWHFVTSTFTLCGRRGT